MKQFHTKNHFIISKLFKNGLLLIEANHVQEESARIYVIQHQLMRLFAVKLI